MPTKQQTPSRPQAEILDLAARALPYVRQIWGVIGYDLEQNAAELGEPSLKAAERLEACLDANHMSTNFPESKSLEDKIYALNSKDAKILEKELLRLGV